MSVPPTQWHKLDVTWCLSSVVSHRKIQMDLWSFFLFNTTQTVACDSWHRRIYGMMHLKHSTIQKSEKKILLLSVNQSLCVCGWFGACPALTKVTVTHQMSKLCVISSGKTDWYSSEITPNWAEMQLFIFMSKVNMGTIPSTQNTFSVSLDSVCAVTSLITKLR